MIIFCGNTQIEFLSQLDFCLLIKTVIFNGNNRRIPLIVVLCAFSSKLADPIYTVDYVLPGDLGLSLGADEEPVVEQLEGCIWIGASNTTPQRRIDALCEAIFVNRGYVDIVK